MNCVVVVFNAKGELKNNVIPCENCLYFIKTITRKDTEKLKL